jgi:hypothetical protein
MLAQFRMAFSETLKSLAGSSRFNIDLCVSAGVLPERCRNRYLNWHN